MEIYGTASKPTTSGKRHLDQAGVGTVEKKKQSFPLDAGDRRYRYYLVWVTELPAGSRQGRDHAVTLSAPKVHRRTTSSALRAARTRARPLGPVALERASQAAQNELGRLLPYARHVIARRSGRCIHTAQPELVIEAARAAGLRQKR